MTSPSSQPPGRQPVLGADPYATKPDALADAQPPPAAGLAPAQLGRYRIVAALGAGAFGVVYRGYDDELRRDVAIKVPHRKRIASAEDAETYLAEARALAALDHPAVVPVHDLGRWGDGLCYVVSKFVEGNDLARHLAQTRLSAAQAADVIARVAEGLHHAPARHHPS